MTSLFDAGQGPAAKRARPRRKRPSAGIQLRVLSLGAGVQSTTLALMAAHGEFDHTPDVAVFADTGWEPRATYEHLAWLRSPNVLPFPVRIVSAGNLREDVEKMTTARAGRFAAVPWFVAVDGKAQMGRRQCTAHYKIEPLAAVQRELLGRGKRDPMPIESVEVWIGISTDEIVRARPGWRRWQINRWPLIEKGMSRNDCLRWLERHGYPLPPKSSCIGCPFHTNAQWREIRDGSPEEWADAVAVDRRIRDSGTSRGMRHQQFMHRSLVPLDQVDLRSDAERGQGDLWGNECSGICGV